MGFIYSNTTRSKKYRNKCTGKHRYTAQSFLPIIWSNKAVIVTKLNSPGLFLMLLFLLESTRTQQNSMKKRLLGAGSWEAEFKSRCNGICALWKRKLPVVSKIRVDGSSANLQGLGEKLLLEGPCHTDAWLDATTVEAALQLRGLWDSGYWAEQSQRCRGGEWLRPAALWVLVERDTVWEHRGIPEERWESVTGKQKGRSWSSFCG